MTEHTDKQPHKSGNAVPEKRPGKARSPSGKRATAPGAMGAGASQPVSAPADPRPADPKTVGMAAGETTSDTSKSLAPDPASITFGSNRPIVATPPKLPASSGLHFSGPSAGVLKASGPQPTSAKASGLTFTNAKGANGKGVGAKPAGGLPNGAGPNGKDAAAKNDPGRMPAGKTAGSKAPEAEKSAGSPAGDETKPSAGSETSKVPLSGSATKTAAAKPGTTAKAPALTKPAIAPQASGRRLEKERSQSGFVVALMAVTVLIGGMAFWMNRSDEPARPGDDLATAPAAPEAAPETTTGTVVPPLALEPSPRAPEAPGPLAGDEAVLSAAEIGEVQQLLGRLDLDPGAMDGILTSETTAAIRSYQEMAGLPVDGTANPALLEELRSVVALYGG
jgi:hypothetical protein